MGNFLGDFLRLPEVRALPPDIRAGVMQHRLIDTYTDEHPVVFEGKRLLYPHFRKYSPVVLDIFFDYLLAKNWSEYSDKPLNVFIEETFATIRRRKAWAPERLHPRLEGMLRGRFLYEYISWEGLDNTFARLRTYISRPELMQDPVPVLQEKETVLNEVFIRFFPDLIRAVAAGTNPN